MQLFKLVNNLLSSNAMTSDKNLKITTYSVLPLSTSCGLIGWLHGCDTLS
jgi:FKBP12-rapamycin complex-associated protein